MKKLLVLLLAAVMVFAFCIPAFAAEEEKEPAHDPVEGSWIIFEVYEINEAGERVLKEKESSQSLYASENSILTFDSEGYAHDITFEGGDIANDAAASWKVTGENEYEFEEEDGFVMTFTYTEEDDLLHRNYSDDFQTLDFVYARAILGEWKLDTVIEVHPGDAPADLPEEGNQSLYSSKDNVIAFAADKKVKETVVDGPDSVDVEGTWEMTEPDYFIYAENGTEMVFYYFRVDDALLRDMDPDEEGNYIEFIYKRVAE